jgi:hypothetical protein
VEVNLQNFEPWSGSVNVKAGGQQTVPATLIAKAAPPPPPSPPKPAATGTFSASRNTIEEGESTTLNWATQNATSVSIEPNIGDVPMSGSKTVTPNKSTKYTLVAKGAGGDYTANVEISVVPKPPPPPPPPPGGGDEQAVKEALAGYKEACESMSLVVLKKSWLGMSKEQENAIKQQFGNQNIKAMKVKEDECSSPKITGDTAEMSCREIKTFTVAGQPPEPGKPQAFQFLFIKKSGKWVLDKKIPK